jgi:peptidoglycan/xylan/chitin deacetylase (PgdA/CDA1 family)
MATNKSILYKQPILMYHSISDSTAEDPHLLRVRPGQLDRQLRSLQKSHLKGVSLEELATAEERGEGAGLVGLTFDDGYVDFLEHAVPVLRSHGMTATVFVVAGRMGGRSDWDEQSYDLMDAHQIRAVAAAGFEVGSHSLNHVELSGAGESTLETELTESRRILEGLLMQPVTSFCYPYGSFDRAAAEAVQVSGYRRACVTRDYSVWDRFTLPRFFVGQRDTPPRLFAKLARHHGRRLTRPRRA